MKAKLKKELIEGFNKGDLISKFKDDLKNSSTGDLTVEEMMSSNLKRYKYKFIDICIKHCQKYFDECFILGVDLGISIKNTLE